MFRAIIFDCFGVLIGRGFDATYRIAGGDPVADRNFITNLLGRANLGLMTQAEFGQEISSHLAISPEKWSDALYRAEQPDPELLAYIETLHQKFKTAILSNANNRVVQNKLGEDCLRNCFDAVIVSAEVGVAKPDFAIYEQTAEKLGVKPSECIFIDDLDGYVQAAERVGMRGILYQNLEQVKAELKSALT